jgi:hydrogenase expression/formation protein HypC
MCLAIPGRVIETFEKTGMQMGRVQFGGVTREACLEYVPETQPGDNVLVHVGFVISRVDEEEARRTYQALMDLDQLSELEVPEVDENGAGSPVRGAS